MKWLIRIVWVYISEGSCATTQDVVFQTVRFAPIESNFLFFLLFLKEKREETDEMKQDPWLWSDSFSPSRCTWSRLYGWMGKEVRRECQVCSLRWGRWWLDCLFNDLASQNGLASSISVPLFSLSSFSLAPVFTGRYSKSEWINA